jgi:hypothetical protein
LAVNKQEANYFDAERFNLRKLNELEVRKLYQTEIGNRSAVLENLSSCSHNLINVLCELTDKHEIGLYIFFNEIGLTSVPKSQSKIIY